MSVDLDRLWAPWRNAFLTRPQPRRCIFCAAKDSRESDRASLVIARGARVFALLNRYPYSNGHFMVSPYRHTGRLESLDPTEWRELWQVSRQLMARLSNTLHPQGFNIGMNIGRVAGAGIPGHLHLHVVPRWKGDVNFMTVIGRARIMSQSLEQTRRLLMTAKP